MQDIIRPPAQRPNRPYPPTRPNPRVVGAEVHAAPAAPALQPKKPPQSLPPVVQQPKPEASTPTPTQKPGVQKPIGVIVAAVVVFLCLATGVIYMTLQNQNNEAQATSTVQPETPAAVPTTAPVEVGVDINDALNETAQLPTSNEDPVSELSDQNLGL